MRAGEVTIRRVHPLHNNDVATPQSANDPVGPRCHGEKAKAKANTKDKGKSTANREKDGNRPASSVEDNPVPEPKRKGKERAVQHTRDALPEPTTGKEQCEGHMNQYQRKEPAKQFIIPVSVLLLFWTL
jgi:hypothetical protein